MYCLYSALLFSISRHSSSLSLLLTCFLPKVSMCQCVYKTTPYTHNQKQLSHSYHAPHSHRQQVLGLEDRNVPDNFYHIYSFAFYWHFIAKITPAAKAKILYSVFTKIEMSAIVNPLWLWCLFAHFPTFFQCDLLDWVSAITFLALVDKLSTWFGG